MSDTSRDSRFTVTFLASGSRGNAAYAESNGRAVLIDCGLSAREALRRVSASGGSPEAIEAVLLTHEHLDHVAGVRVLARQLGIPVYATPGTLGAAAGRLTDVPDLRCVRYGEATDIGGFEVRTFRTSHDAAEPAGFVLRDARGRQLGIATDTGKLAAEAEEALHGCHVLGLEVNHDPEMLEAGPYPPFLKERIRSAVGHLSNGHASRVLGAFAWEGLHTVCGLHRSEQNNTTALATAALATALSATGVATSVAIACQRRCCSFSV